MGFEEWYKTNIDELELKWYENGAMYEIDFDLDDAFIEEWEKHQKEHTNK